MVEQTCARQAEDRGFTDVVSSGSLDYGQLESELLRIHEFSQRTVARAREAGFFATTSKAKT